MNKDILKEIVRREVYAVMEAEESGEAQEYANLIPATEEGSSVSRKEAFDKLAKFTAKYYKDSLGALATLFPPDTKISNWKELAAKIPNRKRGKGEEVEAALAQYATENNVDSEYVGGKGHDVTIGGKTVEVKSSEKDTPQAQLQTTFFTKDLNKFYAFVTGTNGDTITVNLVASNLLYRLALGDEVAGELEKEGTSQKLLDSIKSGLSGINLETLIYNTLSTGREDAELKSFMLPGGVRVRFIVQLSYELPTGKKKKEKK